VAKKNTNVDATIKGVLNGLKETAKKTTPIIDISKTEEIITKEEKKKNRSFMLPESTIKKLKELNFILDKDLSSIVTEAVELYYNQNKDKIEETLK
jgi:hypothetical protein